MALDTLSTSKMNRVYILLWLCLSTAVRAATNTVTIAADNGPGSLRDALSNANPGDTIIFTNTLAGQTIYLTNGELLIPINLTIDASALHGGVVVDAGKNSRVFEIALESEVTLNSLTLTNGLASDNGGGVLLGSGVTLTANNCVISGNSAPYLSGGGGIYAGYNSTLTLNYCTLSDNSAYNTDGGAICNDGTSNTLNNCTLSNNSANYGNGGGIFNLGILTLNNCTLFDNSAELGDGGGIFSQDVLVLNNCTLNDNSAFLGGGVVLYPPNSSLNNTIVAGNSASYESNISGSISGSFSGVDNLTNDNPQLAPLGNYGGPTQTMPPLFGSPAIDTGNDSATNLLTTDQRGRPRLSGMHVDIGAVEAQYAPLTNPPLLENSSWSDAGGGGTFQFSFTNAAGADFTALSSTNLALPLTNWLILGNILEFVPGHYQFTDLGATNSLQRFYRVVSP